MSQTILRYSFAPRTGELTIEPDGVSHLPTQFNAMGNSYLANPGFWDNTEHRNLGGPIGKHLGWVSVPSKYVLLVEPPALPQLKLPAPLCSSLSPRCPPRFYVRWHMARGLSTQASGAVDGQPFLSPVLFVDGHANFFDFRASLLTDVRFPIEETANWIWYKAGKDKGTIVCP